MLVKPLPPGDVAALTELVYTFLGGPVYRTLAETTAYLRQCAQTQRRGLTSRVRSLFRTSSSASSPSSSPAALSAPGAPPPPQYAACDTPLAGPRKLADLLALQGDFAGALAAYQQCAAEVRNDKLALAHNHEMQGATALAGGLVGNTASSTAARSAEAALDAAFALYRGAGERHAAARAACLAAALQLVHGDGVRAHDWLARAASLPRTAPLARTLLAEQAAFALLRAPAPRFRKVCALLVLVGYQFAQGGDGDEATASGFVSSTTTTATNALATSSSTSSATTEGNATNGMTTTATTTTGTQQPSLGHHAYRCYKLAYPMFAGKGWAAVEDLLDLELARHAFALGRHEESEAHLRRLVAHNVQPAPVHATLLRQLLCIYERRAADHAPVPAPTPPELPFPVEQPQSFRVRLNDDPPDCAAPCACAFRGVRWCSGSGSSTGISMSMCTRRVAYVDETITVEVDVTNPLRVPLQFAQMHAVCDFQPENGGGETGGTSGESSGEGCEKGGLQPFTAQLTDVVLAPGETKRLALPVALAAAGTLRVCGFAFDVFSRVWGMRRFSFLPPPAGAGRRTGATPGGPETEPDVLRVARAMPRLQISYSATPAAVLDGEVVRTVLCVHNASATAPAAHVRLAFSPPAAVVFDAARCTLPGVTAVPAPASTDADAALLATMRADALATLDWTQLTGLTVAPGTTVEIPLLFRARISGNNTSSSTNTTLLLHTALAYSSADDAASSSASAPVRFAHAHTRVEVRAGVRVRPQILADPADACALLLRLRVDNLLRDRALALHQLSCASHRWSVAPIAATSASAIRPGESRSLVFRLRVDAPTGEEKKQEEEPPAGFRLGTCRMSSWTEGGAAEDVRAGAVAMLLEAEAHARWEAGEFGPAPRTRRNAYGCADGDDEGNEGDNVSSFGLSSIGALPSFTDAFRRVDASAAAAPPTVLPDLDVLVVHWATAPSSNGGEEGTAVGLTAAMFQAAASVPASACLPQCPVRLSVVAPATATHDFRAEPLCVVPVTVTARNYSTTRSLHVSFDAVVPNNPTREWFV